MRLPQVSLYGGMHVHACMVVCTYMLVWWYARTCLYGGMHVHACMVVHMYICKYACTWFDNRPGLAIITAK